MNTLRIDRIVVPHGASRDSLERGATEQRAGPHRITAAAQRERDALTKPERTSFLVNDTSVRISYDKEIGRVVMQVLDKESATVVKQIPSEEMVAFLRRFRTAVALLVDTTA